MLTLFSVHGFFDLVLHAEGDLEVDFHHTVEDVGLVLGQVIRQAASKIKIAFLLAVYNPEGDMFLPDFLLYVKHFQFNGRYRISSSRSW